MNPKTPKYSYILAIITGLITLLISASGPFLISIAIGFLVAGGVFGFLWPNESWHWGFWITGPLIALLGLSVLFAGQLDMFLKKDLPPLLLAIIAACFGSFISAWYKRRKKSDIS